VHGESPIVVGGESSVGVSKVVVSGPYGHEALRRSNSEGRNLGPDVSSSTACSLVVLCSLNSSFVSTKPSSLDVLGVAGVEGAPGLVRSQDGNISPWGRSPIWIVISLNSEEPSKTDLTSSKSDPDQLESPHSKESSTST